MQLFENALNASDDYELNVPNYGMTGRPSNIL